MNNFFKINDKILFDGKLALLCNQTSYCFEKNKYFFEILAKERNLKQILIPEHGLFAELQDQLVLKSTKWYNFIDQDIKIISLYGNTENSVFIQKQYLSEIDALIIDIQDIGIRYYTYISTIANLFEIISRNKINISVYVLDRPNPAGQKIEGTIIPKKYSSFIGHFGLPHRHGLSIGKMCKFLRQQYSGSFDLKIIQSEYSNNFYRKTSMFIPPSPNIPTIDTIKIYAGQCLFEGTTISEGRGTTRPFEIIGSPFFDWKTLQKIQKQINLILPENKNIYLRLVKFIPKFHKFENQVCTGFQLHPKNANFHSLSFSLILIRLLRENYPNPDFWLKGKYEKGNDKTAIELLAGDKTIIDYLNGKCSFKIVSEKFAEHEKSWKKTIINFNK